MAGRVQQEHHRLRQGPLLCLVSFSCAVCTFVFGKLPLESFAFASAPNILELSASKAMHLTHCIDLHRIGDDRHHHRRHRHHQRRHRHHHRHYQHQICTELEMIIITIVAIVITIVAIVIIIVIINIRSAPSWRGS